MRVLAFCLGLSLCLHGGWLLLSKASRPKPTAEALSLSNMPTLRISEQANVPPPTAITKPISQRSISVEPTVKERKEPSVVAQIQPEQQQVASEEIRQAVNPPAVPARVTSQAPRFRTPPLPPSYPVFAQRQQQTGEVLLAVYLDANGDQEHRQIMKSSGYQLLDQAAEKAVSSWQFLPEIHAGLAVPSRIEIPIQFALSNPT